jgi:glycerol kinase
MFVLALDQGTTSSRAIVFDRRGRPIASAQHEITQHFPRGGWVEHDPEEIWTTQHAAATEALASAGLAASDLAGIGVTNQRETTVIWDRATGRAIHPAIVWQDRRTADWCQARRADLEPIVQQRTGLVLDPYFSGSKIAWLLEHVPGARAAAEAGKLAFGTIDSWLIWKLTAGTAHVTDVSNASRTMLLNLHTGDWDDELLTRFDIPRSLLPRIVASSGEVARTRCAGFDPPVPLCGIAGDQQAALVGQACFSPGLAKNTYGTGCFMLMNLGAAAVASQHRLLTTIAWKLGDTLTYASEGSVFIGGAVVQWLRDGLGLVRSAGEIETLARSVPDNGGVYFVPAFAGLGAPHWDAYARGTIAGLTRGTTAAHLARAALESIAFQVADVLEVMQRDAGQTLRELRVDGGAAANDLLLQIQADLLGIPVVRPRNVECTALGAAMLAGLARGVWRDTDELAGLWTAGARFAPALDPARRDAMRRRWNDALERSKAWVSE